MICAYRNFGGLKSLFVVVFLLNYSDGEERGLPRTAVRSSDNAEGETCLLKNGEYGVCTIYEHCQWAINLSQNGVRPIICNIQNGKTIVCCKVSRSINNWPSYRTTTAPENIYDSKTAVHAGVKHDESNHHKRPLKDTSRFEGFYYQPKPSTLRPTSISENYYRPQPSNLLPNEDDDGTLMRPVDSNPKPSNLLPGPWDGYHTNNQHTSRPPHRPNHTDHYYEYVSYYPTNKPPLRRKRISELKCKEYSKIVVETIAGLPLTTNPRPIHVDIQKCNYQAQELIVGGEKAMKGEFPHMAAVGFLKRKNSDVFIEWNCGGTLISENFVLTAAHCTTSRALGPPTVVRLGELNLKRKDDGAHPVDYMVTGFIKHPKYTPPSRYNDIALLRLSRPVNFNENIRPACLYIKPDVKRDKTIATGWGRIEYGEPTQSDDLLKVVLSLIDNKKCGSLYKAESKTPYLSQGIIESQLCAGEAIGGKDTCQGDSGGPIGITKVENQCIHYVVGVTSFGKHCAQPNAPGVYTRVASYLDWIENIVWPDEIRGAN